MGKVVWVQAWEESDEGWTSRDGYSMHAKREDVQAFIQGYWSDMPDRIGGRAPACYSRPYGVPFPSEIEPGYYGRVEASTNGIRVYGWSPA